MDLATLLNVLQAGAILAGAGLTADFDQTVSASIGGSNEKNGIS